MMSRSKKLWISLVGVVFVLAAIYVVFSGVGPASSQSDYPVLPERGVMASEYDFDFEQLVSYSDLVVEGQVEEILPDDMVTITPEPGSALADIFAKEGRTSDSFKKHPVKIKIKDSLKGGRTWGEEIILYRHDWLEAQPTLQAGDTMVFFLTEMGIHDENGYYMSNDQMGYYYIASDAKVYPAKVSPMKRETSGMNLETFKNTIRRLN